MHQNVAFLLSKLQNFLRRGHEVSLSCIRYVDLSHSSRLRNLRYATGCFHCSRLLLPWKLECLERGCEYWEHLCWAYSSE